MCTTWLNVKVYAYASAVPGNSKGLSHTMFDKPGDPKWPCIKRHVLKDLCVEEYGK